MIANSGMVPSKRKRPTPVRDEPKELLVSAVFIDEKFTELVVYR